MSHYPRSRSYDHAYDPDGYLPSVGEHLVFGQHRLPVKERWCPAWPANPNQIRDMKYRAMLNRVRKEMS